MERTQPVLDWVSAVPHAHNTHDCEGGNHQRSVTTEGFPLHQSRLTSLESFHDALVWRHLGDVTHHISIWDCPCVVTISSSSGNSAHVMWGIYSVLPWSWVMAYINSSLYWSRAGRCASGDGKRMREGAAQHCLQCFSAANLTHAGEWQYSLLILLPVPEV